MEFKKPKIDKKLIYYMGSNVISKVIGGVAGIFLVRYLSKVDYGILTTATAFVGFIFIFVNFGMWDYCLIELSKIKNNIESIIGKILIIFIILYLIGGFITYILYNQIYDVGIIIAILLYFKSFFGWILNGITVILQSKNLFNKISVIQIVNSLIMVIPVILLYIFNFGLNEYVLVGLVLTAIFVIFLWVWFGNKLINISKVLKNMNFDKSILHGSYYFFVSGLMAYIYMQSDILMLSFMAGPVEVSRYAVVSTLINNVFLLFASVFYGYYTPKLTNAFHNKEIIFFKKYKKQYFVNIVFFILLIIGGYFLFGDKIFLTLYTTKYIDSLIILKIYMVFFASHFFVNYLSTILVSTGKIKLRSFSQTLSAILNFILNVILIPHYGAEGATMATLASSFLCASFLFMVYRREVLKSEYQF